MLAPHRRRWRPWRPRLLVALTVVLLACTGLAGCASDNRQSASSRERSTATNVPFTPCDKVACTGEQDGAPFEVVLPTKWNGTLLLYSHGYRQLKPAPPDFAEPSRAPEPAPGWSAGEKSIGQALLDRGFAIAGSAYASNGWAVADGVSAGEKLHDYFVTHIGTPDRTYLWGDSLGGLVTEVLAEHHPDWVSGAAPLCGVLAGPVPNLDVALDVAYAVRTLLDPSLKLTGYASWDEAVRNWQGAYQAILAAGKQLPDGAATILLIGDIVDAPTRTATYDGSDLESEVRARAEAILTALGYGTFGRYDIEQRVGGNPSENVATDYAARISGDERKLLETVAPGLADRLLSKLASGKRIEADPMARGKLAATGTPTGDLQDPTITMHTVADPLVLVQNETVFENKVNAAKDRSGDLVQLYVTPPASYSPAQGAPYGAGHCNFTQDQRLGIVSLLDGWVRQGAFPGPGLIQKTFGRPGQESAVTQAFNPGPWPAEKVK